MGYWVVLSTSWQLEDLQAGLSITIQVICVCGLFVASQFFWQRHALRVARGERVPIARIPSINSPGEVWDTVSLLRHRLFIFRSTALQCFIVVLLALTALFAGPIARFASRRGTELPEKAVNGRLASRTTTCILDNVVAVQRAWDRLDKAGFPDDQLLDWMPDAQVDWQYVAKDWNSTWGTDCQYTDETEVQLTGTGISNGTDNWPELFYQFDDLWGLFSPQVRTNWTYVQTDNQGTRFNGTFLDTTLWFNVVKMEEPMRMALMVVYMDRPPSQSVGEGNGVRFAAGPAPAKYAKVECDLHRTEQTLYQAEPDVEFESSCAVVNFKGHFYQEVLDRDLNGVGGKLPRGKDIFRWFQSYTISKDVKTLLPVERNLSIKVPTVEVAAWFFGITSAVVLLVLVGFMRYAWVWLRYRDVIRRVPETKADWVLHAVGGKGLETLYGTGVGTWLNGKGDELERLRERHLNQAPYAKLSDSERTLTESLETGRRADGFRW